MAINSNAFSNLIYMMLIGIREEILVFVISCMFAQLFLRLACPLDGNASSSYSVIGKLFHMFDWFDPLLQGCVDLHKCV